MRTIIAGSRSITEIHHVADAVRLSGFTITVLISGGARGVDSLGEQLATQAGTPIERFIPDWKTQGKKAGYLRNTQMAEHAEQLIAIHDGLSRGTAHMIAEAKRLGLKVFVHTVK